MFRLRWAWNPNFFLERIQEFQNEEQDLPWWKNQMILLNRKVSFHSPKTRFALLNYLSWPTLWICVSVLHIQKLNPWKRQQRGVEPDSINQSWFPIISPRLLPSTLLQVALLWVLRRNQIRRQNARQVLKWIMKRRLCQPKLKPKPKPKLCQNWTLLRVTKSSSTSTFYA